MLFEVALIKKPTKKEAEEGKLEELILAPFSVIATDERSAGVLAVLKNKDKLPGELEGVEVLVRPFA